MIDAYEFKNLLYNMFSLDVQNIIFCILTMDFTCALNQNPEDKLESAANNEKVEIDYVEGRWTNEEHRQFLLGR